MYMHVEVHYHVCHMITTVQRTEYSIFLDVLPGRCLRTGLFGLVSLTRLAYLGRSGLVKLPIGLGSATQVKYPILFALALKWSCYPFAQLVPPQKKRLICKYD